LMRSQTQEMNISRTTVKKMLSKDGPDSWKSAFHLQTRWRSLSTIARGHRIGSRRTSRRCRWRRSGLPAPMIVVLWTILRGACLN
jgi:hypothetical protein